MGKIKKGKKIVQEGKDAALHYKRIERYFPRRHKCIVAKAIVEVSIGVFMSKRREMREYLDSLPSKFSRDYSEGDYKLDISNVINYYTRWEREDHWGARNSLKRIRKYEKREMLRPFEEIMEEERLKTELEKLTSREDRFAEQARVKNNQITMEQR